MHPRTFSVLAIFLVCSLRFTPSGAVTCLSCFSSNLRPAWQSGISDEFKVPNRVNDECIRTVTDTVRRYPGMEKECKEGCFAMRFTFRHNNSEDIGIVRNCISDGKREILEALRRLPKDGLTKEVEVRTRNIMSPVQVYTCDGDLCNRKAIDLNNPSATARPGPPPRPQTQRPPATTRRPATAPPPPPVTRPPPTTAAPTTTPPPSPKTEAPTEPPAPEPEPVTDEPSAEETTEASKTKSTSCLYPISRWTALLVALYPILRQMQLS